MVGLGLAVTCVMTRIYEGERTKWATALRACAASSRPHLIIRRRRLHHGDRVRGRADQCHARPQPAAAALVASVLLDTFVVRTSATVGDGRALGSELESRGEHAARRRNGVDWATRASAAEGDAGAAPAAADAPRPINDAEEAELSCGSRCVAHLIVLADSLVRGCRATRLTRHVIHFGAGGSRITDADTERSQSRVRGCGTMRARAQVRSSGRLPPRRAVRISTFGARPPSSRLSFVFTLRSPAAAVPCDRRSSRGSAEHPRGGAHHCGGIRCANAARSTFSCSDKNPRHRRALFGLSPTRTVDASERVPPRAYL